MKFFIRQDYQFKHLNLHNMFNTNRGLLKFILLNLLTCNIYKLFVLSHISNEINIEATSRDRKHTMHYLLLHFVLSWLTLGIAIFVWNHRLCNRIGDELVARDIHYSFNALDFWLWDVLGLLIIIGPFIYRHKQLKAMNLINWDYVANRRNADIL